MNTRILAGGVMLVLSAACAEKQVDSGVPGTSDSPAQTLVAAQDVSSSSANRADINHRSFEHAINLHPKFDGKKVTPTGLAVADINNDGLQDLVFGGSYDFASPRPLGVYINQGDASETPFAPFTDTPTGIWWGKTKTRIQNVCAGDLNHDHCPDVVAVHFDKTGGNVVSVYMNQTDQSGKCLGLEKKPSQTPSLNILGANGLPAMGFACALGDIDADGDLDLGIAATLGRDVPPTNSDFGVVGVYENHGDKFGGLIWDTGLNYDPPNQYASATDIKFADVNQDGQLDIVASMLGLQVFLGDGRTFSKKPNLFWNSIEQSLTMHLSIAWSEKLKSMVIAIAANNNTGIPPNYGFNRIFAPCSNGDQCKNGLQDLWKSDTTGKGSAIALTAMNGNGTLDIASSRYGAQCNSSNTARMRSSHVNWAPLQGGKSVTDLNKVVHHAITGQDLLMWDFNDSNSGNAKVAAEAGTRVVTLGVSHLILAIESVKNTAGDKMDYQHTAGDPWLSLNAPLTNDDSLTITYQFAKYPDLFLADSCGAIRAFENR